MARRNKWTDFERKFFSIALRSKSTLFRGEKEACRRSAVRLIERMLGLEHDDKRYEKVNSEKEWGCKVQAGNFSCIPFAS